MTTFLEGDKQPHTPTDWNTRFNGEPFSRESSNEWYLPWEGDKKQPADRDRTEVRDEFIASPDLQEPDLEYGKINRLDYRRLETFYDECLEAAKDSEDDILYEQAARKLAELYRHKEVARRLGRTGDMNELSRQRAVTMNAEIFGDIETGDYDTVLSDLYAQATEYSASKPEAQELLEVLGGGERDERSAFDFELNDKTIELLRKDLFTVFPDLQATLLPHEERLVGMSEAADQTNRIIAVLRNMKSDGWKARVGKGRAAKTSAEGREIVFGEDRDEFISTTALNAVSVHEAIGHGFRAYMAENQTNSRRQAAMPGTADFEEGLSTALEQLISGEKRLAGTNYLFALGIHHGLDRGGEERTFRESYEILYRSLMVKNPDMERLQAQHTAYQECMRTRRGGAIDHRDISYFMGARKAYAWLNEIAELDETERIEKIRWVLSGRFDSTNEAQAEQFEGSRVQ